jgi:SAM-dependent methyltransferase
LHPDPSASWEDRWRDREPDEVSWFQAVPTTSLELLAAVAPDRDAHVVDVGGGASTLVDHLLDRGWGHLTVVDVAERPLELARRRLGERAATVRWVVADARDLALDEPADVWHDRAVLHFLVDDADREAYVARVTANLVGGGHAVVSTFAPEGPATCSGLPVRRDDADGIAATFGSGFELVDRRAEDHVTPAGVHQAFVYAVLRRR